MVGWLDRSGAAARLLEIISPAGFEQYFVELAELLRTDPDNVDGAAALGAKYGVQSDPAAPRGSLQRMA